MARTPRSKREINIHSINYMVAHLEKTKEGFKKLDEITLLKDEGFSAAQITAYKNKVKLQMKADFEKAGSMYQWIIGENTISLPTAFTDSDVDNEDKNIRTKAEGGLGEPE